MADTYIRQVRESWSLKQGASQTHVSVFSKPCRHLTKLPCLVSLKRASESVINEKYWNSKA